MIMCATVSCVEDNRLMVINNNTQQEVAVNTNCLDFEQGDRVKIIYNGIMTMSIPPQINARRIIKLNCP
ncbi:MAG: YobA family protein [Ruminococcus flavefaciens]|nr:YobA family protein [Ruminococcus flavefaciens]MCM1230934.1 YobA family protein [Ruminococcus flavefaciens]